MGAHPWFYFVPYQSDINKALLELKQQEFAAGRYNPAIPFPEFPIGPNSPRPGPKHSSIKAALNASMEDGTRSILDIERVSTKPDYQTVCPIENEELMSLYATTKPTRAQVEDNMDFFEAIERG